MVIGGSWEVELGTPRACQAPQCPPRETAPINPLSKKNNLYASILNNCPSKPNCSQMLFVNWFNFNIFFFVERWKKNMHWWLSSLQVAPVLGWWFSAWVFLTKQAFSFELFVNFVFTLSIVELSCLWIFIELSANHQNVLRTKWGCIIPNTISFFSIRIT